MLHLPWLLDRTHEAGGEPCGHVLMASCPPEPFSNLPNRDVPFGDAHTNPEQGQTWELSKSDLATLLDLSRRLDLDGEITPIVSRSFRVSYLFSQSTVVVCEWLFLGSHSCVFPRHVSNKNYINSPLPIADSSKLL